MAKLAKNPAQYFDPVEMLVNPLIGQGTAATRGTVDALVPPLPEVTLPSPTSPIEAAPPMPLPDDDAARRARRRSISELQKRRGRASTILTDSGVTDALGG